MSIIAGIILAGLLAFGLYHICFGGGPPNNNSHNSGIGGAL